MQNDMDPDPLYVHYSNARSVQCIVQVVMRIEHWHAKLFVALQKNFVWVFSGVITSTNPDGMEI